MEHTGTNDIKMGRLLPSNGSNLVGFLFLLLDAGSQANYETFLIKTNQIHNMSM
jgi:hypothetical protein